MKPNRFIPFALMIALPLAFTSACNAPFALATAEDVP